MVFHAHNPDCEITIDTSGAPELKDWVQDTLGPTLVEWYPKIVAMLPSAGFVPPKSFSVDLRPRGGVAATSGTRITANSNWLAGQIHKEATGAIVHEEVHVVQQYSNFAGGGVNGRRGATQPTAATRPATRPAGATTQARRGRRGGPNDTGWLTEGIADYIRWWYYEPDGPRRYPALTAQTSYAGSYTVTANFLHYVAEKYDKDLVVKMNAAMRQHTYSPELWQKYTGKPLEELGAEWKKSLSEPKKS